MWSKAIAPGNAVYFQLAEVPVPEFCVTKAPGLVLDAHIHFFPRSTHNKTVSYIPPNMLPRLHYETSVVNEHLEKAVEVNNKPSVYGKTPSSKTIRRWKRSFLTCDPIPLFNEARRWRLSDFTHVTNINRNYIRMVIGAPIRSSQVYGHYTKH